VNLKHPLRQIETNPRDSRQIPDRLAHGRLPFRWVDDNDHLGTLMPFGAPSTPSFADGQPKVSKRKVVAVDSKSRIDESRHCLAP
jgi:hypothetical protein